MIFTAERSHNIYLIMLTSIGLSPYRKSIVSRIIFFFYFVMYISGIFFQLMKCITTADNLTLVIKYLSYFLPTMVCTINYNSCYFNIKAIEQSLEHIKLDWNTLTDSGEIETLSKYTYIAYIFSLVMYMFIGFIVVGFTLMECSPVILDTLAPMNVSRPRTIKLQYELFIDQEQYFFLYVTYEALELAVGFGTLVAIGTLFFSIGSHACAGFKIASDLIHNIVTDRTLQIPVSQRTHFMYWNIRRAVHIHRRATKLTSDLLNDFQLWFFFIILIGVVSLSCVLFRFLYAITQLNDVSEVIICFTMFFFHILYMLMGNVAAQIVIDHSTEMSKATYNTLWYVAPLPIQKLLLFLLISLRDQKLIFGGVIVASLETFSMLVTSSISYFTVMYSMLAKN